MKLFRQKEKNPLDRSAALSCKPMKFEQVNEERLESGCIILSFPVVMRPWFVKVVRRLGGPEESARIRQLQLDELGTAVWDLLDGKRTVRHVISKFAKAYQLHPREAEVSVTQFLRDLGKRGIIGLK